MEREPRVGGKPTARLGWLEESRNTFRSSNFNFILTLEVQKITFYSAMSDVVEALLQEGRIRDWIPIPDAGDTCGMTRSDDGVSAEQPEPWDPSQNLLGEPSLRFRDNLRNDTHYITSWANAGFTNQFISIVNLLYLASLTGRVPIIPPFAPDQHISREAGIITFGEIFNLTHLRTTMRTSILEWHNVKDLPSSSAGDSYNTPEVEDIGCWSTRMEAADTAIPAETHIRHLGLDPSYTRVPNFVRMKPHEPDDNHVSFSKLAAVIYPKRPYIDASQYPLMAQSPLRQHRLPPDERLTCFDTLYYATSGADVYEWRFSFSPAWNSVGQHVLFNREFVERSSEYIRRAFDLEYLEEIPPFIAIHIRHGDFGDNCGIPGHCLDSLDAFAAAVKRQEKMLLSKKGIEVRHWLVSSDETDQGFWDEVNALGWSRFDHEEERTLERYGEWQTPLVDVVAHSLAAGFVGTEDSTFSLVGGRRVEDWNGGTYELVAQS
ncbi:hypothetical protein NMY22_g11534 [Coprinellus aureogranulatus]|nr:hypothetical protein NMY22_g11534 [Coprinellus aureogranulatus]